MQGESEEVVDFVARSAAAGVVALNLALLSAAGVANWVIIAQGTQNQVAT